ncbi:Hypothetical protein NCS54_00529100 [Fusarium falciforme]|uniref:Hypothetical protein n=1 Tax=Fusarium falciforme TaxID=195108 RepID=UPI0023012AE3|nr:Hypothetical protein NCS54_00529100 [Fusarium falciforme]WAO87968.1 Hypothetical protein NCS54_00529100 [Fusarium falciforme]
MAAQPQRPDPGASELDDVPDPKGHPIISNLGNFTAGLFAPIPESETFVDPADATKLDGLQRKLQAMDAHAVANRDNFLDLCVRERERIKQEGRRLEALGQRTGQTPPDAPRPGILHGMIANMEAEPLPGADVEIKTIPKPNFMNQNRPVRERQAIQLLDFAGFAADLAETREIDLAKRREELEAEIRAEQTRESQARAAE